MFPLITAFESVTVEVYYVAIPEASATLLRHEDVFSGKWLVIYGLETRHFRLLLDEFLHLTLLLLLVTQIGHHLRLTFFISICGV